MLALGGSVAGSIVRARIGVGYSPPDARIVDHINTKARAGKR